MHYTAERRKNTRYALRCCVSFFRESSFPIAEGVTQDVSSAGFYCLLPVPLTVGESLTCLLKMPSTHPAEDHALTLECMVRVVRLISADDGEFFGIGCQLQGYRSCALDQVRYKASSV